MADHGFWSFAQRDPRPLALVDPDERTWTRGELLAECNRIVHGLRALGLEHGDAVAICMPNCAEFYAIYLACLQAGWYLTPINFHLAAPEVAYIVQDCGAKAFIGHERVAVECSRAAEEIGFPKQGRFAVGSVPGFRPFAELTKGQSTDMPKDRAAGAVMNYTSGTTGKPKGVRRPLAPLDPDTLATLFTGFLAMFGIKPEDGNVHIVGSPLYHTAVLVFGSASMNMGHPVVLM